VYKQILQIGIVFTALYSHGFSAVVLADDGTEPEAVNAVTLDIDYSNRPLLSIHAKGVGPDELIRSLGDELGFTVKRIGKADPAARVIGRYKGELQDLLPWVLRGESYAVVWGNHRPDGRRNVEQILLMGSHPGYYAATRHIASATDIDKVLEDHPNINPDMREFLEESRATLEAGTEEISIDLYDVPTSITDRRERITEPLHPEFETDRLENRAPGMPPRYLSGSNDAAQHDVASALARTSAMARSNLEALTNALDATCFQADCPGITREEIAERERLSRQQSEMPKTTE